MWGVLTNAASELGETLEERCGLPIGRGKTMVRATTEGLAKRMARNLRGLGARQVSAPRRLGLRLGEKGNRRRALQRARLGRFAKKMGRLRNLAMCKKIKGRTLGRMHSALLAGPLYGCEVHQLGDDARRKLRRQAADFRRLGCRSGSPGLFWGIQIRATDPECRHWWLVLELLESMPLTPTFGY